MTVATYASFASLWLVPRLAEFQGQHPGIEIRIDASDRHGRPRSRRHRHRAALAAADRAGAAARPAARRGGVQRRASARACCRRAATHLKTPADLDRLPVLAMDESVPSTPYSSWARWCELAGIAPIEGAARLVFTYVDQSVQAAVRGQGVALVRTPFLDDLVASSDLVTPFPAPAPAHRLPLLPDRQSAATRPAARGGVSPVGDREVPPGPAARDLSHAQAAVQSRGTTCLGAPGGARSPGELARRARRARARPRATTRRFP
ncbi:MAG: LysR substrate-binding domain-containing protein [Comamonadaceae bacterium]|nr:LysR substrate-binding domain-containing protein [Comamonadaceae bacterium]